MEMTDTETMTKTLTAQVLLKGAEIADGPRNNTHGNKERSFEGIADFWNTYLFHKYDWGGINAEDVAWMMNLMKMARRIYGEPIEDHAIDASVYAAMTWELCQERKQDDGPKLDFESSSNVSNSNPFEDSAVSNTTSATSNP